MPQLTLQQIFDLAVQHHQAGRLEAAASLYRQLLNYQPNHAESLHLLGVVEGQNGRIDQAIALIERALALKPDDAQFLSNLGVFLARSGRVEEAIARHRRAVALLPNEPDPHRNLAVALFDARRLDEAIAEYRAVIALRPGDTDTLHALGRALVASGRKAEAVEVYRRALSLQPGTALQHFELATLHQEIGRLEAAVAAYGEALRLQPQFFEASNNLGNTLAELGRREEAIGQYRAALALRADCPETHFNLGNTLTSLGRIEEGIASYRKAIALRPDYADAINNLGAAYRTRGLYVDSLPAARTSADTGNIPANPPTEQDDVDEALTAFQRALEIRPDFPAAHLNMGNYLKEVGRIDEAIVHYRKAARLQPDAGMMGNLLYTLHFHPDYGPAEIWQEHREWNERFVRPLAANREPHQNDRNPDRRLRIGYVTPDFRDHPVGRFMLPLLGSHDHSRFEIFSYCDLRVPGALTPALRRHVDVWRDTLGMSDEALAGQIRRDRIDILVDLTMHLEGSRLLVFARKPAPVQVTYLAYCGTTGVETIDYRFTDSSLDPTEDDQAAASSVEPFYSEKSVRLRTYWCSPAPREAPAVGPPPALAAEQVTFGSLNNFSKVSAPALEAWCEVLRRVPGSRLILHTHEGKHRAQILDRFANDGIDRDQIEFAGYLAMERYLRLYNRIDIALDPFPYCGGTTTCDALWMGVPLVTLAGRTAVSRGGASLLSNIGLSELIATEIGQYVDFAVKLAGDLPRLQALRSSLRDRMQRSPLMDASGFARDVEAAYRKMWRNWCASHGSTSDPARTSLDRANSLHLQGHFADAIAAYRQALELRPDYAEALNNLGIALRATGDRAGARECFVRATTLQPQYADALNNLAVALRESGQIDASIEACERALTSRPDSVPAQINLGNAHMAAGRIERAIECYGQAEVIEPSSVAAHNRLYALHFRRRYLPGQIREEHERWAQRFADPLTKLARPHANDRRPDRKLRVGYVSPDFRSHPVGRFILPLLENHDREKIEIVCYSDVAIPDDFTARARKCSDLWRQTASLSDEQLSGQIRGDGIDILVDLTMHMDGSRLLAFARKPAPVQVTYLAYCSTTGLSAIDYRLTDALLDPPGSESAYTEQSIRLKAYWCYQPPPGAPEPTAPPSRANGRITFGCLNNFSKVSEDTRDAWRKVLGAVPGSSLLLHAPQGKHRQQLLERFATERVTSDRITFIDFLPLDGYLNSYQRIDIALDPFPYGGGTTTLDALWMGVPVVTLAGETAVSRGGLDILTHLGLPEYIAHTPQQYVEISASLASDPSRLTAIRSGLRQRMLSSVLMEGQRFARDVEAAYQQMWRSWCEREPEREP